MSFGRFEGDVIAKWMRHRGNDRDMELQDEFVYVDPDGKRWTAPPGSRINGASIPRALWQTVGPPFVGDYRRASVVHDVACVEMADTSEAVHLMFYNAMRADRVGWTRANVMFQAVKRFGPRWSLEEGSLEMPDVDDRTVEIWIASVERAAKQVRQSQGVDAVEERAQAIFLQMAEQAKKPQPEQLYKKTNGARVSQRSTRVSGVRLISSEDPMGKSMATAASFQLPGHLRGRFPDHRSLKSFRESSAFQENIDGSKPSGDDAEADPSLMAAAGVEEMEATPHLRLTLEQRIEAIDQALLLIEENYVHLPLKEAMYAVNPVRSLKLLREKMQDGGQPTSTVQFHKSVAEIFLSTRDLHTNYFLPAPFSEMTAFLPFLVEEFFEEATNDQRRYLLTRVFAGFTDEHFEPGVEILRWSGVDIQTAVEANGDRYAGSNSEARRARGLETLTVRSLIQSLPPEEDFVLVEYRDNSGEIRELRVEWEIFRPPTNGLSAMDDADVEIASAQGIDLEQSLVRIAKKQLFAPEAVARSERVSKSRSVVGQGLTSLLPDVVEARSVDTDSGTFGYLRIRTFSVQDAEEFVDEIIRLVDQLPRQGLIIDVRGNGGGLILAGEQLLQLLTPRRIEPTLFQLRSTPLNRTLVERAAFLRPWRESMRQAAQTGAIYTKGFPITNPERANATGQRYHGPVALITDGLCYSTTDIFAAGFQDHKIGQIIGVDNNTGAGGANVWGHDLLRRTLQGTDSPYSPLPAGAGMRVSMRRTIRVAANSGTVLEDLGVVPDELYRMTRNDLLNENVDLLERAAQLLASKTVRSLQISVESQSADEVELAVKTENIERLDFYEGQRPIGSVDISDSSMLVALESSSSMILVQGFSNGSLVASRRLSVN